MTSTVIVRAHCSNDKQVRVVISDKGEKVEEFKLMDGQEAERYVYDGREVVVFEELKNG